MLHKSSRHEVYEEQRKPIFQSKQRTCASRILISLPPTKHTAESAEWAMYLGQIYDKLGLNGTENSQHWLHLVRLILHILKIFHLKSVFLRNTVWILLATNGDVYIKVNTKPSHCKPWINYQSGKTSSSMYRTYSGCTPYKTWPLKLLKLMRCWRQDDLMAKFIVNHNCKLSCLDTKMRK